MRSLIWGFYDDLKAYAVIRDRSAEPPCVPVSTASSDAALALLLDRLLARLHANKAERLLMITIGRRSRCTPTALKTTFAAR